MPKTGAPHDPDRSSDTRSETSPVRFTPFADDAAVQTIGGLSVENGRDRIAIHGSLDLARDARGLERARALAAAFAAIVAALEAAPLPEQVAEESRSADTVKNPFA
ncbi:hypothetical protein [Methylobacterium sp. Leaf88]|uniref:hypothetical protein n=1 Tax=Methylobacterium sp. Leaf88 TaxID=1736244 RepID=UPI000ABBEE1B|nr:hypothetical protein [Methylobacterium sp. Leaf88]